MLLLLVSNWAQKGGGSSSIWIWVNAMHEEFHQFTRNYVWELVLRPNDSNIIGNNGYPRINPMKMVW